MTIILTLLAGLLVSNTVVAAQELKDIEQQFAQMREELAAARAAETQEDYCKHLGNGLTLNEKIVAYYQKAYEAGEISEDTIGKVTDAYDILVAQYDADCR